MSLSRMNLICITLAFQQKDLIIEAGKQRGELKKMIFILVISAT
jgi:hypothetical protein